MEQETTVETQLTAVMAALTRLESGLAEQADKVESLGKRMDEIATTEAEEETTSSDEEEEQENQELEKRGSGPKLSNPAPRLETRTTRSEFARQVDRFFMINEAQPKKHKIPAKWLMNEIVMANEESETFAFVIKKLKFQTHQPEYHGKAGLDKLVDEIGVACGGHHAHEKKRAFDDMYEAREKGQDVMAHVGRFEMRLEKYISLLDNPVSQDHREVFIGMLERSLNIDHLELSMILSKAASQGFEELIKTISLHAADFRKLAVKERKERTTSRPNQLGGPAGPAPASIGHPSVRKYQAMMANGKGVNGRPPWMATGGRQTDRVSQRILRGSREYCFECLLPGHQRKECKTDVELKNALRLILRWIAPKINPERAAKVAAAFYENNGDSFGEDEEYITSQLTNVVNPRDFNHYLMTNSYKVQDNRKVDPYHSTSAVMIDTGNPKWLAGVSWFKAYEESLVNSGFQRPHTMRCPRLLGFGDNTPARPLQRAMSVPIWPKLTEEQDQICLLVDIDIVPNDVGSIMGKKDEQALCLQLNMSNSGNTAKILGEQVKLIDTGDHLFVELQEPSKVHSEQKTYSLQSDSEDNVFLRENKKSNCRVFILSSTSPQLRAEIEKIIAQNNHPSKVVLKTMLNDAGELTPAAESLIDAHQCHLCPITSDTEPMPVVSATTVRGPGLETHLDYGQFDRPDTGEKHICLVATDKFSSWVAGKIARGVPNQFNSVDMYLAIQMETPEQITIDLGSNLANDSMRSLCHSQGTRLKTVPRQEHQANASEKGIDLIRAEWTKLICRNPRLSSEAAFQQALRFVNQKKLGSGVTRQELYLGRKPRQWKFLQNQIPMETDKIPKPVKDRIQATLRPVERHRMHLARQNMLAALRKNIRAQPYQYHNGEWFWYWNSERRRSMSSFLGPAQVIGQTSRLVIGYWAGKLVVAHSSRTMPCIPEHIQPTRASSAKELEPVSVPAEYAEAENAQPLTTENLDELETYWRTEPESDDIGLAPERTEKASAEQETEATATPRGHEPEKAVEEDSKHSGDDQTNHQEEEGSKPSKTSGDDLEDHLELENSDEEVAKEEPLMVPTSRDVAKEEPVLVPISEAPSQSEERKVEQLLIPKLGAAPDAQTVKEKPLLIPKSDSPSPPVESSTQPTKPSQEAGSPPTEQTPYSKTDLKRRRDTSPEERRYNLRPRNSSKRTANHEGFAKSDRPTSRSRAHLLNSGNCNLRYWMSDDNVTPPKQRQESHNEYDLYSMSSVEIPAGKTKRVPTGISLCLSYGCVAKVAPSGAISGVLKSIDQTITEEDTNEVEMVVQNTSDQAVTVNPDEIVARIIIHSRNENEKSERPGKKYSHQGISARALRSYPVHDFFTNTKMRATQVEDGEVVPTMVASRNGPEIQLVHLTSNDRKRVAIIPYFEGVKMPEFQTAMAAEIESFKENHCYDLVEGAVPVGANLVTTRWVLCIKVNQDGTKKYKARLVARGYEDSFKYSATSDAPTASKVGIRMVMQLLVERQWQPTSWDFKSAFLQGMELRRPVYVCGPSDEIWKLRRPIYGLVSGPRSWYDRLSTVLSKNGFQISLSDAGVFKLTNSNGETIGAIGVHVDDTIGGGDQEFHQTMDKVAQELKVGSMERESFVFKGVQVESTKDKHGKIEIAIDGDGYVGTVLGMEVPETSGEDLLSIDKIKDYRSVVGTIGFMASEFRPDLSVEASMMASKSNSPTKRDAVRANAAVEYAKRNQVKLCHRGGADEIVVYHDASLRNRDDGSTQGGHLVMFTRKNGSEICGIVHWSSKKLKRKVDSTSSAETLSAREAADSLIWIRDMWEELAGKQIGCRLITDSNDLSKNILTTKTTTEKRLRPDMAILREGVKRNEFKFVWCPKGGQLADALTKQENTISPSLKLKKPLLEAITSGETRLNDYQIVTKTCGDVSRY